MLEFVFVVPIRIASRKMEITHQCTGTIDAHWSRRQEQSQGFLCATKTRSRYPFERRATNHLTYRHWECSIIDGILMKSLASCRDVVCCWFCLLGDGWQRLMFDNLIHKHGCLRGGRRWSWWIWVLWGWTLVRGLTCRNVFRRGGGRSRWWSILKFTPSNLMQ